MSVTLNHKSISMAAHGAIIHFTVTGKLEQEDYNVFVPEMERQIAAHKPIRIIFELNDFKGWSAGALWEECKLAYKHLGSDVERIALIGDKQWEKNMAVFTQPFTKTDIRYFDTAEKLQAETWIQDQLNAAA